MKHFLLFTVCLTALLACQKKQELEIAVIASKSMVCGSCAKNVETAVEKVVGVKNVAVNLESKTVEVRFIPVETNIDQIETAIINAGYDANDRKRNPMAYEKLDACCKIDK